MKKIVISAVNFTEGGPLSILKDCLKTFQKIYKEQNIDLTVFVHKIDLVKEYVNDFQIVEYPLIKKSWLKRLYFEYYQSKSISDQLCPDLWIALHDISPNVSCKQVVYCHNPSPFYKLNGSELLLDTKFYFFCLFYKFLYRINIRRNLFVIVQQEWLRKKFKETYNVKSIVAHPISVKPDLTVDVTNRKVKNSKFLFFYPAFPRVAKNFDVLLKAAILLSKTRNDFIVLLSTDGTESPYAKELYNKYKNIDAIKFDGRKTREQVFELYNIINCMVFPSNLETWGLPITEYKAFNKPMLLADLEYAHETLGKFEQAKFFNYNNHVELASYMDLIIDNKLSFDTTNDTVHTFPFFENWDTLVNFLCNDI